MKKLWTKKWLRYPLLAVVLLVGTVLLHSLWLPSLVASQAAKVLGVPVSVSEVHLTSYWPVEVAIRDFKAGDLLTLESADVFADVPGLIDGNITLPTVAVRGVRINLEVDDEGRLTNVPTFSSDSGDSSNSPSVEAELPSKQLLIKTMMDFEDVKVAVTHPGGRHTLNLANCALDVQGPSDQLKLASKFDVAVDGEGLSFVLKGDVNGTTTELPELDLVLKGEGDLGKAQALLSPLTGTLPFKLSGNMSPDLRLSVDADELLTIELSMTAADLRASREGFDELAFKTDEPFLLQAAVPFEGLEPTGVLLREQSLKSELATSRVSSVWVPLNVLESTNPLESVIQLIKGQTSSAAISSRVGEAMAWMALLTGKRPEVSLDALMSLSLSVDKGHLASRILLNDAWMVTDRGRQAFEKPPELVVEADLKESEERQDLEVTRLDLNAGPLQGRFRANLHDLQRLANVDDPLDIGQQHLDGSFTFDAVAAGRLLDKALTGQAEGHLDLDTRQDGGVLNVTVKGQNLGLADDGNTTLAPELEVKADYSRDEHDLWTAHLRNLRLRETDLIDVQGSAELNNLDPKDPAAASGRLELQGAMGGRQTLAARLPELLPKPLDFSPMNLKMVVAREQGQPWDVRFKLNGDHLSWTDAHFAYRSPLTEATVRGVYHPEGRLEDGEVRLAWGRLVQVDAKLEGTAEVWTSSFRATLDPTIALEALAADTVPADNEFGKMEPWALKGRIVALSRTHQDWNVEIKGNLDLTRPELILREPFSLTAAGSVQGPNFAAKETRFVIGPADNTIADITLDPFKHNLDGAGLPALAGRVTLSSQRLEALFRDDFRKQLGELEFSGPLAASFEYEAPHIKIDADLTTTTLRFGEALDKKSGVALSLFLDTKKAKDNMRMTIADQVLSGTIDLETQYVDIPTFDLDLVALGKLSPMLGRQGFSGRVSGQVSGGLNDLAGRLGLKSFRWRPFPDNDLQLKGQGGLEARATNKLTTLDIKGFDIGLGKSRLHVTGDLVLGDKNQQASLGITGPNLNIDEILGALPQVEGETVSTGASPKNPNNPAPDMTSKIDTKAVAKLLENKKFGFHWDVDRVLFKDIEATKSTVAMRLANQSLMLDRFAATLNEGRVSGSARKVFVGGEEAEFHLTSKNVNLDVALIDKGAEAFWLFALVRDIVYGVIPGVTGRLNGSFDLKTRGLNPDDLLTNAMGQGDFSFDDAKIVNPEWLKNLGQAMQAAAGPLSIKDPELSKSLSRYGKMIGEANFDKARVRLRIEGRTVTSKMELFGPKGAPGISIKGRTIVDSNSVTTSPARFEVRLENLSASDTKNWNTLVRTMFDTDHLPLGDRLDSLNIDFDTQVFIQAAIKEAIRRKLEEEAKKRLGEGVGDLLKGILGGD